jgi:hypothetical protein
MVRAVPARWRLALATATALLLGANAGSALVRYHPYESTYFNRLAGGLRGAARTHRFPQATDYWGSSYRQGLAWLRQHAERDATLYVSVLPHIVALTEASWGRPDLRYVDSEGYAAALEAGRTVYVMFVTREEHYEEVAQSCVKDHRPVHTIEVDGFPILLIFKVRGPLGCGAM